jgi:hypothetical protein
MGKRGRRVALADRNEPVGLTSALLAQSLGFGADNQGVRTATDLIAGFDPEAGPRDMVKF